MPRARAGRAAPPSDRRRRAANGAISRRYARASVGAERIGRRRRPSARRRPRSHRRTDARRAPCGWTSSRPCSASGSVFRNGESTTSAWTVEQTSWMKPGCGQLQRARGAADRRLGLEDAHRASGARQGDGRGQAVRAGADDDRVERQRLKGRSWIQLKPRLTQQELVAIEQPRLHVDRVPVQRAVENQTFRVRPLERERRRPCLSGPAWSARSSSRSCRSSRRSPGTCRPCAGTSSPVGVWNETRRQRP